uniref:Uncharacterized protein n=1 Tax=Strigamia maritima TaxID=126957 RepID=T1JCP1_STRMM
MSKLRKTISQSFKMTKCLQVRKQNTICLKQPAKPPTNEEHGHINQMPVTPKPKGRYLSSKIQGLSRNKRKFPETTPVKLPVKTPVTETAIPVKRKILKSATNKPDEINKTPPKQNNLSTANNNELPLNVIGSPVCACSPNDDISWKYASPTGSRMMTQTSDPRKYVPDPIDKDVEKNVVFSLYDVWKFKNKLESQNGVDVINRSNLSKRPKLRRENNPAMEVSQIIKKPVSDFNPSQKPNFSIFDNCKWPHQEEFEDPEFIQATQVLEDKYLAANKSNGPASVIPVHDAASVTKCDLPGKTSQPVQKAPVSGICIKPKSVPVQSSEKLSIITDTQSKISPKKSEPVKNASLIKPKSTLNGTTKFTAIQRKSQQFPQPPKSVTSSSSFIPLLGSRNSVVHNSFVAMSQTPKSSTNNAQGKQKLTSVIPKGNVVALNTIRKECPVQQTTHRHLSAAKEKPTTDNTQVCSDVAHDLMDEEFEKLMIEYPELSESSGGSETLPDQLQHTSSGKRASLQSNKLGFVNGGVNLGKECVDNVKSTKITTTTRNSVKGNIICTPKASVSNIPVATSSAKCNLLSKRNEELVKDEFTKIKPKETTNTHVPNRNLFGCGDPTRDRLSANCSGSEAKALNRVNCSTASMVWPDDDDVFASLDIFAVIQKFEQPKRSVSERVATTCNDDEIARKKAEAKAKKQLKIAEKEKEAILKRKN